MKRTGLRVGRGLPKYLATLALTGSGDELPAASSSRARAGREGVGTQAPLAVERSYKLDGVAVPPSVSCNPYNRDEVACRILSQLRSRHNRVAHPGAG